MLHAKGREPQTVLLTSLKKRGLDVRATKSVHTALATLALAHREHESCVLVLSEPKNIPTLARLIESVERFAPRSLVWAFELGATPPLGPYAAAPKPSPAPEPTPRPAPPRSNQPPNLRLTGDAPTEPTSADILDPDELDALLKPYDK